MIPIDIAVALALVALLASIVFVWARWFKPSKGIQIASKHEIRAAGQAGGLYAPARYLRGPDEKGTIRAVDQYGNTLQTYFKEPRSIQEEVAYDKAMAWVLTYNKAADIVVGRPADAKTRALIQDKLDKIWENLLSILSKKDAQIWINTPSADLSGEKPIDLMNSGHADSVLALLENTLMGNPS